MLAAVSGDDKGWNGVTAGSETALPLFFHLQIFTHSRLRA
jgi:hypothetical protein